MNGFDGIDRLPLSTENTHFFAGDAGELYRHAGEDRWKTDLGNARWAVECAGITRRPVPSD